MHVSNTRYGTLILHLRLFFKSRCCPPPLQLFGKLARIQGTQVKAIASPYLVQDLYSFADQAANVNRAKEGSFLLLDFISMGS